MREIKFRAWEKTSESMVYDVQNVSRKRIIGESACESFQEVLDSWEYEIMQYTGLKDKNGVEIYEGDICKVSYPDWYYDQHLTTNIFEVAQLRYAFRFLMDNRKTSLLFDKAKEIEIIGNIYENPELLEEITK